MNLGQISKSKTLGGFTLKFENAKKMPQQAATAFTKIFGGRDGCTYTPQIFVGEQLVNGVNYMLIVKREKLISGGEIKTDFSVVVINIPAGDTTAQKATLVSETDGGAYQIICALESGFKTATDGIIGVSYKPLLELGTQIVKGKNYHFVCESKIVYPGAVPYLTRVVINEFEKVFNVVEIEKI